MMAARDTKARIAFQLNNLDFSIKSLIKMRAIEAKIEICEKTLAVLASLEDVPGVADYQERLSSMLTELEFEVGMDF